MPVEKGVAPYGLQVSPISLTAGQKREEALGRASLRVRASLSWLLPESDP